MEMLDGRGAKRETVVDVWNCIVIRVFCMIGAVRTDTWKTTIMHVSKGLGGIILGWGESPSWVVDGCGRFRGGDLSTIDIGDDIVWILIRGVEGWNGVGKGRV